MESGGLIINLIVNWYDIWRYWNSNFLLSLFFNILRFFKNIHFYIFICFFWKKCIISQLWITGFQTGQQKINIHIKQKGNIYENKIKHRKKGTAYQILWKITKDLKKRKKKTKLEKLVKITKSFTSKTVGENCKFHCINSSMISIDDTEYCYNRCVCILINFWQVFLNKYKQTKDSFTIKDCPSISFLYIAPHNINGLLLDSSATYVYLET